MSMMRLSSFGVAIVVAGVFFGCGDAGEDQDDPAAGNEGGQRTERNGNTESDAGPSRSGNAEEGAPTGDASSGGTNGGSARGGSADAGHTDSGSSGGGTSGGSADAGHTDSGSSGGGSGGGTTTPAACTESAPTSLVDIATGVTRNKASVTLKGVVATTTRINMGECWWSVFVRDPDTSKPYGLEIKFKPAGTCPANTVIPSDIKPGDILDIVGTVLQYRPTVCAATVPPQMQVLPCSVKKVGSDPSKAAPVVVSNPSDLKAGDPRYKGMLVTVKNVAMAGKVTSGWFRLQNSDVQVVHKLYYTSPCTDPAVCGSPRYDANETFTSITGINFLYQYANCEWVLGPRDKCTDISTPSRDCR